MRNPLFSRRRVALNGRQLEGEWRDKRFDFKGAMEMRAAHA
jgi:hypothetical protein